MKSRQLIFKNISSFLILSFCAFQSLGCAMFDKTASLKKQEAFQAKAEHFKNLKEAVEKQSLTSGMTASEIKGLYGEPDDIFSSGSTTGRFEIWSYEEVKPQSQMFWRPIRLYFNNERLISWNY